MLDLTQSSCGDEIAYHPRPLCITIHERLHQQHPPFGRSGDHLANVGGGVSGPGILPVSLRAVYECREAFPDASIVGVGGVASGEDAVAMLMAGANALEVGTATFADPRAPWIVQRQLGEWMAGQGVDSIDQLIGAAHG